MLRGLRVGAGARGILRSARFATCETVAIFVCAWYTVYMDAEKVNAMNSVTLAYVGDAVFSLYVRTRVVESADYKSGELNSRVNACVKAVAQSVMLERILPELTDEEKEVVRRGRNAHTPAKAKNAGLMDYKRATALEALFGWLYLKGDTGRLEQLESACVACVIGADA